MNGPRQAPEPQQRPGRWGLHRHPVDCAGLACFHRPFPSREGDVAGVGPATTPRRQRPAAALTRIPRHAWVEVSGCHPACEGRVAGGGTDLSDRPGASTQQGQLVRRDLAPARKDRRIRSWRRAGIPPRGLQKKRIAYPVSRNREALYRSVSRNREAAHCSVSRAYRACFCPSLCSVSRTPSRYSICCYSLKDFS